MALIRKFEDVMAWQEARKLVQSIYQLTRSGDISKDFGLRDQLQRAAVSVMNNIAEGFDCESNLEFARFLVIARRSAVEVQSSYMHRTISAISTKKHTKTYTLKPPQQKPSSTPSKNP